MKKDNDIKILILSENVPSHNSENAVIHMTTEMFVPLNTTSLSHPVGQELLMHLSLVIVERVQTCNSVMETCAFNNLMAFWKAYCIDLVKMSCYNMKDSTTTACWH